LRCKIGAIVSQHHLSGSPRGNLHGRSTSLVSGAETTFCSDRPGETHPGILALLSDGAWLASAKTNRRTAVGWRGTNQGWQTFHGERAAASIQVITCFVWEQRRRSLKAIPATQLPRQVGCSGGGNQGTPGGQRVLPPNGRPSVPTLRPGDWRLESGGEPIGS
jgi:hypothetical protein